MLTSNIVRERIRTGAMLEAAASTSARGSGADGGRLAEQIREIRAMGDPSDPLQPLATQRQAITDTEGGMAEQVRRARPTHALSPPRSRARARARRELARGESMRES